ncbi:MAG: dTMP kinase, partial [Acidimicrobiia bacterium]|nr:dTMP kinase [Acidimicrobiia bacterium]
GGGAARSAERWDPGRVVHQRRGGAPHRPGDHLGGEVPVAGGVRQVYDRYERHRPGFGDAETPKVREAVRRARYLVAEGTEGVGKTTLCDILAARLMERGIEVVRVREPGGTPLGEAVREVLLHGGEMSDWSEALLFAAQRAELAERVVRPALANGKWVLSDRCYYSSLAYQGYARRLGVGRVWSVNRPALGGTLPDLVVWMDMDAGAALARQQGRDRIGAADIAWHREVWKGYRSLWTSDRGRMMRVDAAAPTERIGERLVSVLEKRGWLRDC